MPAVDENGEVAGIVTVDLRRSRRAVPVELEKLGEVVGTESPSYPEGSL